MRNLAVCGLIVTIVASVFVLDAHTSANAAAWCADSRNGGTNCGFYTYEQCRATVSGDGGFCRRNLFEDSAEKPAARRQREAEPKPKSKEKERAAPAERPAPPPVAAQPAPAPPAAVQQPVPTPPTVVQQPTPAQQPANNFQAARALIIAGKYEAGIAAMKSLGSDDHPDVAGLIGFANSKLGHLSEARAWYNKALAADPNHLATWRYSGVLHVLQGELAMARADLARIMAICGGTACREYQDLNGLIAAKGR